MVSIGLLSLEKPVARADEQLALVSLGPPLVEALGEVMQVEGDEIDNCPACHPDATDPSLR